MDFEVPRDINSEIPDSFRRIRCIRQNMKTENIIETNGEFVLFLCFLKGHSRFCRIIFDVKSVI